MSFKKSISDKNARKSCVLLIKFQGNKMSILKSVRGKKKAHISVAPEETIPVWGVSMRWTTLCSLHSSEYSVFWEKGESNISLLFTAMLPLSKENIILCIACSLLL